MRIRSILQVRPEGEALESALAGPADVLAFALNDARDDLPGARAAVAAAVGTAAAGGKGVLVTVNHPRTRLVREDLEAIVTPGLSGVFLPHAVEPQDVRDVTVLLREFEYTRGIEPGTVRVFPVIDTARGLARAMEIAGAVPRVGGMLFDSHGYARETGARDEEIGPRFAYARGATVAAARAHDGLAIVKASRFELTQLAHYGFAGALLSDPVAVPLANQAFTPTASEVAHARAVIEAYAEAKVKGEWSARIEDQVIEADTVRRAHLLLAQAQIE